MELVVPETGVAVANKMLDCPVGVTKQVGNGVGVVGEGEREKERVRGRNILVPKGKVGTDLGSLVVLPDHWRSLMGVKAWCRS